MAAGQTLYSDISSLVNNIQGNSLFTLRQTNVLVNTVTVLSGEGMNPRTGYDWGSLSVKSVGEGDDVAPEVFDKSLRVTLTPSRKAAQVFLSDQRLASDWEMVSQATSLELGNAFSNHVDTTLAGHFSSLTGGTVGSAGSALTWNNILDAHAIMHAAGVPAPYYCVIHTYQYLDLVKEIATSSTPSFQDAPQFRDRMINSYFMNTLLGDVIFAVTGNVSVDGSDDATGAMYSPLALAYDLRRPFNIRPERDESREGFELNASLWYASGVWDASRGVQIISDASAPS